MRINNYLILFCLSVSLMGCSTAPPNMKSGKNVGNLSNTHKDKSQSNNWEYVLREIENDNIVNVIDSLKKYSASGNEEAQYYLGTVYEYGVGEIVDKNKALEHYISSANKGYPPAQYRLALTYVNGDISKKDYLAAYKWSKNAAENQYRDSYGLLGYLYENGYGVGVDAKKSIQYYQAGSDIGDPSAMFHLAEVYYHGKSASIDHNKAFILYEESAKGGVLSAQDMLGNMYEFGYGTDINPELAAHWYKLSASRGHPRSQNSLGVLYALGSGVPKSQPDAIYWYRKSAEQGYSDAQFNLGARYEKGFGVDQDYVLSRDWYEKAASQGHEKAIYNLAIFYLDGNGVEVNNIKALKFFENVIKIKDAKLASQSEYMIGYLYENGLGIGKSVEAAIQWYKTAASHGSKDAKARLEGIEEQKRHSGRNAVFYYNEGLKELQNKNHIKAEQLLRRAIGFKPNFVDAYYNLGAVLGMQGRYEESIKLLKKAISMFPQDADLHSNIGFSYSKIFEWNSAIEHYKKALSIDPGNKRNRYNLNKALEYASK